MTCTLASAAMGSRSGDLEGAWHWEGACTEHCIHAGHTNRHQMGSWGHLLSLLVNKISLGLFSGLGTGSSAQLLSIW